MKNDIVSSNKEVKIKFKHNEMRNDTEIENPELVNNVSKALGLKDNGVAFYLLNTIISILPQDNKGRLALEVTNVLELIKEIKPKDAIEAMLAIQMIGSHLLATESIRRGRNSNYNGVFQGHIALADKLNKTYVSQMLALRKYRNKADQRIVIEHLNVEKGGKLGIASINKGGDDEKSH